MNSRLKLLLNNLVKTLTCTNEIRDYSHSMGELYYHRMLLTRALMHSHKDKSWKSRKHHDGTMIPGFFIVGISTDDGDITYHYEEKYWSLFEVKELEKAPMWDGIIGGSLERLLKEF